MPPCAYRDCRGLLLRRLPTACQRVCSSQAVYFDGANSHGAPGEHKYTIAPRPVVMLASRREIIVDSKSDGFYNCRWTIKVRGGVGLSRRAGAGIGDCNFMRSLTACPLCNSGQLALLKEIAAADLVAAWKEVLKIDITGELHGTETIRLHGCPRCGLQSFAPTDVAGSAALYRDLQNLDWYYVTKKWEHTVAIKDLAGCQMILEIGCGSGEFLARMQSHTTGTVRGIELSERAVATARQRGLSAEVLGLKEAAERWPGQYDAVCAFQVLEHVPDPGRFLETCCALLAPGGKLVLAVPNAESWLRFGYGLLDQPPHHMSKWPGRTLRYLSQLFPLRLERLRRECLARYHIPKFVKDHTMAWRERGAPSWLCEPAFRLGVRKFIGRTGLRHLLVGHTIYAVFRRVERAP